MDKKKGKKGKRADKSVVDQSTRKVDLSEEWDF
jgi:hypothetical protein